MAGSLLLVVVIACSVEELSFTLAVEIVISKTSLDEGPFVPFRCRLQSQKGIGKINTIT